jgi:hypothetical protein
MEAQMTQDPPLMLDGSSAGIAMCQVAAFEELEVQEAALGCGHHVVA